MSEQSKISTSPIISPHQQAVRDSMKMLNPKKKLVRVPKEKMDAIIASNKLYEEKHKDDDRKVFEYDYLKDEIETLTKLFQDANNSRLEILEAYTKLHQDYNILLKIIEALDKSKE